MDYLDKNKNIEQMNLTDLIILQYYFVFIF